jgi:hypothetical protein
MMRFRLKRLMAMLLPISFLWLFVACVTICGREGTQETHEPSIISSACEITEITETPDCQDCPLTSFPRATAPERVTFKLYLQTAFFARSSFTSVGAPFDGTTFFYRPHKPSFTDPPFNRLPALRI